VELLLKYGAQPDLEDRGAQTLLSRAICANNAAAVELLNSYQIAWVRESHGKDIAVKKIV